MSFADSWCDYEVIAGGWYYEVIGDSALEKQIIILMKHEEKPEFFP